LAEWLGTGLQNLVHRFDSGRRLRLERSSNVSADEEQIQSEDLPDQEELVEELERHRRDVPDPDEVAEEE
jgi:hypothetical protein